MDQPNLTKRKELASALLYELKTINSALDHSASEMSRNSGSFYEDAFNENRSEFETLMESYHQNVVRTREIKNEITISINSWYDFIKNENEIGKMSFPFSFFLKKRKLYKKIYQLNNEISSITINSRFIKEQLTVLEHQLEIKAVSLARSGGDFQEYEKLQSKQKALSEELKYLLPTIPDLCPAELSNTGIEKLITQLS